MRDGEMNGGKVKSFIVFLLSSCEKLRTFFWFKHTLKFVLAAVSVDNICKIGFGFKALKNLKHIFH